MEIIDSEGRLFGVVNVVDALVVLLVVAVGVAGIALISGGIGSAPGDISTTHATVDLGVQPDSIAEALDEGDRYTPGGNSNLTITDVYLAPEEDGTRAVVRVRLEGPTPETGTVSTSYDGAPPRLGRELVISTARYNATGTIRAVGGGARLATNDTRVVLQTVVPAETARELTAGTPLRTADRTVATVRDVYATEKGSIDQRHLVVLADVRTYRLGDQRFFAGTALGRGASVTLPTPGGEVSGRVVRVEPESGLARETRDVLVTDVIDVEDARALNVGDTYSVAGRDIGTVESVTVYDTGNPDRKRVYAGLVLETLGFGEEPRFGEIRLRKGATVPFRTEEYELAGNIVRLEATGERATREVLVTDVIDAEETRTLAVDDTYTVAGKDIGTVESVTVYGTNNPDRKRVYVGLALETLSLGEDPQFGETRLRKGATVPFRTDAYELAGTVVRLGATEQRGAERTRTVTLEMRDLRPERADSVREGMAERANGDTVARITGIEREASQVVLTSESGNIFLRDHPLNRDLTMTAQLSVRETTTGVRFKGETIQPGSTVTLDLGSVTIRAEVVSL